MLAKRKMESQTKSFPRGNTISMEASMSVYRIGACCLSGEAIREAAELDIRAIPLGKWNQWVKDR